MTHKKFRPLLTSILFLLPLSGIAAVGDMSFDPANSSISGTTSDGLILVEGTDSASGYVCDDGIDNGAALAGALEVAERYFNAESCQESTNFNNSGNSNFILDNVNCNGSESTWYDCPRNPDFSHNCVGSEAFGLVCTGVGEGQAGQPEQAEQIPTMSIYGLMLTTLGLLLVATRRLRKSAGRK